MKKCDNCGKVFPVEVRINGQVHNLNSRRYCLDCSPFGMHNTRPLKRELVHDPKSRICTACSQEKPITEFYKKGRYSHSECRSCFNKRSTEKQRKNKIQAVAYKGGRCVRCGYQGHVAALDFHHLDPQKKNFAISTLKNHSFRKMKDELDKCILLCANCHRELTALGSHADWSFLDHS